MAPLRLTLVLGFASGALLLAVEVVAANFLWLMMDATVYAEGIVVGTVMIVMGAGSALYLRGRRAGAPVRGLVVAAFALFSLSVAAWLTVPASLAQFSSAIMTTGRSATPAFFAAQGALVLLVLGGPALAIGAVYTALCEWAISAGGRSPRPLGRLSACHYAGALVGNLATVFFLLPRLGMTTTLAWTGLAAAIASSLVWTAGVKDWRRRLPRLAALAVAFPFFLLAPRTSDLTFRVSAAGPNRRVLFHQEDGAGVVEVFEVRETGHRQLFSNRLLGEGEDSPVARVLKWQEGSLPALLHPAPRRVLAIGLGTGMTLRGVLRPEVERLVCVEYSRGVIEAAPFFAEATGPVLTDPRFVLLRQDGRDFLRLTPDLYDLIVQDLFFPYRAGVGNLYTVEHYRRLAGKLSSGGRAAQWIALHQISPEDLRSLVASFSKAFPDTTLWLNGRFLLLYGGQEPLRVSWPDFARRAEQEAPVPGTDAADLLSQRVAFEATPGPIGPDVRPNTDDNALIEYRTPLVFNKLNTSALEAENLRWLLAARRVDTTWLEDVAPGDRARLETAAEGRWLYVTAVLRRIEGGVVSEEDMQRIERSSASLYLFRRDRANGLVEAAVQALKGNQPALALPLLNQALTWDPAHLEARFFLAQVAFDQGETVESLRLYGSLLADFSRFHLARKALIHTLCRAGRPEEARREAEVLNGLDPESGATRTLEEACGRG
jgi:spermidine synthase